MNVPFYQVDAFASRRFAGNPAAVMVLESYPGDDVLQTIAAENNLSETAFLVPHGDDYRLRWFTPTVEVALCGHATLASAAVVLTRLRPAGARVVFHTLSGALAVERAGDGYAMDFPARAMTPTSPPPWLADALGAVPRDVLADRTSYLVRLDDAGIVRSLDPDLAAIARLDRNGVIVTAAGDDGWDFVSRYFASPIGIPEDPVTGSAHCALAPYWANRLGRRELRAFQASRRGGEIGCRVSDARVELRGRCVFYLEGSASL
ncbi:PhzF family phenazine biosynthesis protein [Tahibacter soli]|uniref:PhzF family phenazine biosynthesis protein n=1 Tax=Tahibacter soli TaxID=2983605 RepID=A0A9X3YR83_9GAMM|nr:PhzF family phenazine biosynthesis protein [Tahibacter soli]MDC8016219.1 PhzF family phenazine biosynthesis protein [Tahibacter soli]